MMPVSIFNKFSISAVICSYLITISLAQGPSEPTLETGPDDDSGVVYIMLFLLMMLNTVTPIMACLYQRYGRELIHKAQSEIDRVTSRISDRLSDAGRKMTNQMRT